jgi:molecular chaperone DnaK (HSP70)
MPMVRQMIKDTSRKPPDTGINPVTAVALGASIYAHILETGKGPKAIRTKSPIIRDVTTKQPAPVPVPAVPPSVMPEVRFVTAHGVGVRASHQGRLTNVVLIHKNTPVPAKVERQFRTRRPQKGTANRIKITVTQGDTTKVDLAEVLGTAHIAGIPQGVPVGQPVWITMEFNEQGRLHLNALYVPTGQKLNLTLDIPGGLRKKEVQQYRRMMEETGLITPVTRKTEQDEVFLFDNEEDEEDDFPLLEPLT